MLAILKGEHNKFPPLEKRGGGQEKLYPVLRGMAQKVSDPFPIL